jgi:hypothetical protein
MITKYENMWKEFAGMIYDAMPENTMQIAIYDMQTEKGRLGVIVEDSDISKIAVLSPIIQKIVKKELHIPLVISKFFVETSTDSFPLEFFNMQSAYENVYAKTDLLKDLVFNKFYVRLEMEREVKRQIILIRPFILENMEQVKNLHRIIDMSSHALLQVLKGFLFLKDIRIPYEYKDLVKTSEDLLKEDLQIIYHGLSVHNQRMNKDEALDFLNIFISKMMALMYITEKFPVE